MHDIHAHLNTLRRPTILLKTARAAVTDYKRSTYIGALTGVPSNLRGRRLMEALMLEEARLDSCRRAHDITYRAHRHVSVLTALLAEAGRPIPMKLAA